MAVHSQSLRLLVPHIFVWGSCFWFSIPAASPPPVLLRARLSHTIFHTTTLSRTTFHTTTLSHTIFHNNNFATHTQSFKTIFHTQLCHAPSFTHDFVTHHLSYNNFVTHNLLHNNFVTHTHKIVHTTTLQHTRTLSFKTIFHTHTQLCHTPSFKPLRFAWRACHLYDIGLALVARLAVSRPSRRGTLCGRRGRRGRRGTCSHPPAFFRGRRGTWRHQPSFCAGWLWWRAWSRYSPAAPRHFAWQARHLATSTFVLRGRTALGWLWWRAWARYSPAAPRHFAWQARHLATSTFALRGSCGTCSHPPSFCVAGVALMTLGWLWWRASAPLVARGAAALCVGRRGTWRHQPSFCVAGRHWVGSGGALGPCYSPAAPRHFAWQARHLATSTFALRGSCGTCSHPRFVLRGRRGPYDIGLALVARFGAVSCPRRCGTLRGRRGTWRHRSSLCVAVV